MDILVRVVCDKRLAICYFILIHYLDATNIHYFQLNQNGIFHSKIPLRNLQFWFPIFFVLLSLGHATSTARATLKHNVVSRLRYFHFHFSSLTETLICASPPSISGAFHSSLSNSRIPSIFLFGYSEILFICFLKFGRKRRKFERKMARLLWKSL